MLFPEYENLNSTLDQLDSCLDVLEQQSDSLYERMAQLLGSNKQTRQELEEANKAGSAGGTKSDTSPKEQDKVGELEAMDTDDGSVKNTTIKGTEKKNDEKKL